jgi:ABC-2 type transport system permease protein
MNRYPTYRRYRLWTMELRMFALARFTLLGFGLLLVAMLLGALNARAQADAQRAAIERIRTIETQALAAHQAALARYARPGPRLPYWQDPSDVAGYMRYGLTTFAVKPPSVLAALAVGQSTLQPFYLRIELDYLSPPEESFDFVNPGVLGLGEFDLAFVLVYLMPLVLIAIGAPRLAEERDAGILPLLAAGAPSMPRLALLKFGVMAAVAVPVVLTSAGCALLATGVPLNDVAVLDALWPAAFGLAGYTVLWCAVTAAVAARVGLVPSYLTSAAIWAVSSLLVPAAVALAVGVVHPTPSPLRYLDALRGESNLTPAQRDAIFIAYVRAHPAYAAAAERLKNVSYATKQVAVQMELERRMAPQRAAEHRAKQDAAHLARVLGMLSPSMVMEKMLQAAAGTDDANQQAFLDRSRTFAAQLRRFFWPRALADAAAPVDACAGCAARMAFTAHAAAPRFVPAAPTSGVNDTFALALHPWMLALAAIFAIGRRAVGPRD